MIDRRLRATKDRLVEPIAAHLPAALAPGVLTAASTVLGLGAGALAAAAWVWPSVVAWLLGRLLDGLDGAAARRTGRQSDLGGYLDLMGDTVGYMAIPFGIAASQGDIGAWVACAALLASFYLNTMSWTFLAAVAEKRGVGAASRSERTTIHMPPGLVEGAETIVLYTVMLALPGRATTLFWFMAALVVVTIGQRVAWAMRSLR